MKTLLIIVLCSLMSFEELQAQDVKCSELFSFVVRNGHRKGEVSGISLWDSSWLKSVVAYSYKNTIFVVAEIKKDDFSFSTKKYIYCGIPPENWDNFQSSYVDINLTYGKKFHKYIIDYKCDCN